MGETTPMSKWRSTPPDAAGWWCFKHGPAEECAELYGSRKGFFTVVIRDGDYGYTEYQDLSTFWHDGMQCFPVVFPDESEDTTDEP